MRNLALILFLGLFLAACGSEKSDTDTQDPSDAVDTSEMEGDVDMPEGDMGEVSDVSGDAAEDSSDVTGDAATDMSADMPSDMPADAEGDMSSDVMADAPSDAVSDATDM